MILCCFAGQKLTCNRFNEGVEYSNQVDESPAHHLIASSLLLSEAMPK